MDFTTFKFGVGRSAVISLMKLDIADFGTWEEFRARALENRAAFGGAEGFYDRGADRFGTASSGERLLILAILYAMDYRAAAEKLAEDAGTTFLSRMEYGDAPTRLAAACCLARID